MHTQDAPPCSRLHRQPGSAPSHHGIGSAQRRADGLTDVQHPMQAWDQGRADASRAKQGWPQILTDLRIVREDGRELPRDGKAFGELQARGPHTLQAYYKVCMKA